MFPTISRRRPAATIAAMLMLICTVLDARATQQEAFNAKFQSTYIWQRKAAFDAAYSGPNSLRPEQEKSYSFTATAAFGWRPWAGTEVYFDPEVAQGVPLSRLTGLGGMSNGEMARTSGANPTFYRARLFVRQVWGLGGGQETIASAANQLASTVDKRRLTLTVGNVSVLDIFDANAYSHDPRTQFINWSLMTHGAYDFAADSRGYTWGAALEYLDGAWAIRAGRFIQPRESNGLALDPQFFRHFGDQLELQLRHEMAQLPGKVRLLVFRNVSEMGNYADALALPKANGGVPAVADVRTRQAKIGYAVNVEQALPHDAGVFARASWADGKTETYAFAEIDRSLSGGVLVSGQRWFRPDDSVGLAMSRNSLSQSHRDYLAAGGLGFFTGDGKINYRPETIGELFYNVALGKSSHLGLNLQRIANPAYNHDRGPVNFVSLRLHGDF